MSFCHCSICTRGIRGTWDDFIVADEALGLMCFRCSWKELPEAFARTMRRPAFMTLHDIRLLQKGNAS
jgi:hypothetical protein